MSGWRAILTDWRFVTAAAAILLITHLRWAAVSRNGADLARCGALWGVLAVLLVARPIIRLGYARWFRISRTTDGGGFEPSAAEIEEERQIRIDARHVQIYGPALLVAGTLLWGYGDLLGAWLFPVAHATACG